MRRSSFWAARYAARRTAWEMSRAGKQSSSGDKGWFTICLILAGPPGWLLLLATVWCDAVEKLFCKHDQAKAQRGTILGYDGVV
jgi:hypothetical protein